MYSLHYVRNKLYIKDFVVVELVGCSYRRTPQRQ